MNATERKELAHDETAKRLGSVATANAGVSVCVIDGYEVPEGWELLLPGPKRVIRAYRQYLDSGSRLIEPWKIEEGNDTVLAFEVKPLGELVFRNATGKDNDGCSIGLAWVETTGPILIKRKG